MVCIDVSIVSHGHGQLVVNSLESLLVSLGPFSKFVRVWVTLNLPEPELEKRLLSREWTFDLRLLRNGVVFGFGANHNRAFAAARTLDNVSVAGTQWFVVMNPDISWPFDVGSFWSRLISVDRWPPSAGLLCPTQLDVFGGRGDFARTLLTPLSIAVRTGRRLIGLSPSGAAESVESADWVNGACMIFRTQTFAQLEGFDERFFMYCEDIDICLRLQLAGWSMHSAPVSVVHDARRATRRSLRHLAWHLRSILLLWASTAFWRFARRLQARQSGA